MNCSVCLKAITSSGKIVPASCGHLVHAFKNDCASSDFCTICETNIEIFAHVPIIKLNLSSGSDPVDVKEVIKADTKEMSKVLENKKEADTGAAKVPASARTLDDEFIKNQFKMQRDITNAVLKKLKVTENLVSLIKDQQSQILSLVGMFTKFEKEFKELKLTVDELYNEDDYEDETESESEACSCCKDDEVVPKEV